MEAGRGSAAAFASATPTGARRGARNRGAGICAATTDSERRRRFTATRGAPRALEGDGHGWQHGYTQGRARRGATGRRSVRPAELHAARWLDVGRWSALSQWAVHQLDPWAARRRDGGAHGALRRRAGARTRATSSRRLGVPRADDAAPRLAARCRGAWSLRRVHVARGRELGWPVPGMAQSSDDRLARCANHPRGIRRNGATRGNRHFRHRSLGQARVGRTRATRIRDVHPR